MADDELKVVDFEDEDPGFWSTLGETFEDFGEAMTQGSLFGFGDELEGVFDAGFEAFREGLDALGIRADTNDQSVYDAYIAGRDRARARMDKARERSPIATTTGEIVGGVTTGMGTAGATGAASLPAIAGQAAIEGGIYGLGESREDILTPEGPTTENLGELAEDVGISAGLGAAVPLGIAGGGKALSKAAGKSAELLSQAPVIGKFKGQKELAKQYGEMVEDPSKFTRAKRDVEFLDEELMPSVKKDLDLYTGTTKEGAKALYESAPKQSKIDFWDTEVDDLLSKAQNPTLKKYLKELKSLGAKTKQQEVVDVPKEEVNQVYEELQDRILALRESPDAYQPEIVKLQDEIDLLTSQQKRVKTEAGIERSDAETQKLLDIKRDLSKLKNYNTGRSPLRQEEVRVMEDAKNLINDSLPLEIRTADDLYSFASNMQKFKKKYVNAKGQSPLLDKIQKGKASREEIDNFFEGYKDILAKSNVETFTPEFKTALSQLTARNAAEVVDIMKKSGSALDLVKGLRALGSGYVFGPVGTAIDTIAGNPRATLDVAEAVSKVGKSPLTRELSEQLTRTASTVQTEGADPDELRVVEFDETPESISDSPVVENIEPSRINTLREPLQNDRVEPEQSNIIDYSQLSELDPKEDLGSNKYSYDAISKKYDEPENMNPMDPRTSKLMDMRDKLNKLRGMKK